jgi:hypothetical protein
VGRARIWWAIGLTLALHAAVAWFFWPRASKQLIAENIVFVAAVLHPAPMTSSARASEADTVADPRPTVLPSATPPATSSAPIETIKPRLPEISTPTSSAPIAYLPFDAVDTPATPIGDWLIDADALPRYTELRLVLRLWISATGVLDRWEVTDQTIATELTDRILADLDKTPIQPATLNNVAVPSVRQLEVVLSRQ